MKKAVPEKFRNIDRKAPELESLFNKGRLPATLLKRDSNTVPVNIAKFLRTSILKNICKWLLLSLCSCAPLERFYALHYQFLTEYQKNHPILAFIFRNYRSNYEKRSIKVLIKIWQNSQGNYYVIVSFVTKLTPATLLNQQTLAQLLSCEHH